MFLIMGISPHEKKLDFQQTIICDRCGSYGRLEVYFSSTAFSLFFIPLFKWNKHYFAKLSCCDSYGEINQDLGQEIAKGNLNEIELSQIDFPEVASIKRCASCSYPVESHFAFCPKCGEAV